jgi:hypothetical protein
MEKTSPAHDTQQATPPQNTNSPKKKRTCKLNKIANGTEPQRRKTPLKQTLPKFRPSEIGHEQELHHPNEETENAPRQSPKKRRIPRITQIHSPQIQAHRQRSLP